MKRLRSPFLVIAFISGILMITGCKKKEIATLTTAPATDLTLTSAKTGGNITDDGNAGISQRGVCWSTSQNPTTADNKTTDGTGAGSFESQLTGLVEGTTYHVRAYATNSEGTAYGDEISFATVAAGQATITTRPVTGISFTIAKTGGDITSDGGSPVTEKGICWNTAENPTVDNNKLVSGTGNDGFDADLIGLSQGTTYYVRAFATNKAGTSYGNQVTFTTSQVKAPTVLITAALTGLTTNAVVSGGSISDSGGGDILARGVVWGTAPNPTLENSKTTDGTGVGEFTSIVSSLTPGTVYYLRSYATNSAGTSYGPEIKFSTSIADTEGNIYKTTQIGGQLWMAENLKATRFSNNSPIALVNDSLVWPTLSTPAYSWYRNNPANKNLGGLYNWFAVATGNLCPQGWHVPTQMEYRTMEQSIGVPADSTEVWGWRGKGIGTHLKNTVGWNPGNGDNLTGFSAIPSGYRAWISGQYRAVGLITYFWTSTDDAVNHKPTVAWYRRLDGTDTRIYNATTEKQGGKSVRCMKNQ